MNRTAIITLSFLATYLACGMAPVSLLVAANYLAEPTRCWLAGLSEGQDLALLTAQAIWCAASLSIALKVTGINRAEKATRPLRDGDLFHAYMDVMRTRQADSRRPSLPPM